MSISIKTHKILWGRAAHRCAICQIELAVDKTEVDDESLIGDECHIVARQEGGPRGDGSINPEQKDTYANLILLCKNHHKQVDDQRNYYTLEQLQEIKAKHEAWVRESLKTYDSKRQSQEEIYAAYIYEWERKAFLGDWHGWTSWLLAPQPSMWSEINEKLQDLPTWLLSRVWPRRYDELESAFFNFGVVLSDLLRTFLRHAEQEKERYVTVKFYKSAGRWNENYDEDLQRYESHVDLVHDLTFELTRSVNYICDHIRNDLVSSYRINEGRLLLRRGEGLGYVDYCPEYRGEERIRYPYPGLERFLADRNSRDFSFATGDLAQARSPVA